MGISILDRNSNFTDYVARSSTTSVATENQKVFILSMIDNKFASEQVLSRQVITDIQDGDVTATACPLVRADMYTFTREAAEGITYALAVTWGAHLGQRHVIGSTVMRLSSLGGGVVLYLGMEVQLFRCRW